MAPFRGEREGWDVLYTAMCVPEAADASRSTLILYSTPARHRWTSERERESESEVNECYTVVADGLYTLSIQIKITLNNLLNP